MEQLEANITKSLIQEKHYKNSCMFQELRCFFLPQKGSQDWLSTGKFLLHPNHSFKKNVYLKQKNYQKKKTGCGQMYVCSGKPDTHTHQQLSAVTCSLSSAVFQKPRYSSVPVRSHFLLLASLLPGRLKGTGSEGTPHYASGRRINISEKLQHTEEMICVAFGCECERRWGSLCGLFVLTPQKVKKSKDLNS